jgi:phage/plasmid-like protein (TIGR03299 family)
MAAYFDTGFSVREPMWHCGYENTIDDYPRDWADAREKAGLLWEPVARPAYKFVGMPAEVIEADEARKAQWLSQFTVEGVVTSDLGVFIPLKDHKLIERDDNEHVLGVVGDKFELVLHSEMGEIVEAILGVENVKFETAGSVRDGAQVWVLVYLDEPYTIVGDNTQTLPFLALLNAHDGSGSCKLVATQVRIVCWNTYRAAELEGDRHGRQFTFRHTAGIHDRIEEAKLALAGVREEAQDWKELAAELFGLPVDDDAYKAFVADFIPEPPAEIVSEKVRENIDRARKQFKALYLDSPTGEAHRGTALGLVDASVEYLDHIRGYRSSDTYLGRTLLRVEPLKAKAVKLAREHCG